MSEFKDDGSFRSAVQGVFNSLADQVDEVEFDAFEPRLTAGGSGFILMTVRLFSFLNKHRPMRYGYRRIIPHGIF